MKFMVLTVFFAFACITRAKSLGDDIVGISSVQFVNHIKKAIQGLSKMTLTGDNELGLPIMDPYKPPELIFSQPDKSGKESFKIKTNITIKGLSQFNFRYATIKAHKLDIKFGIAIPSLEIQGPYTLQGFLFDEFIPVYGQGEAIALLGKMYVGVTLVLALEQSTVKIEDLSIKSGSSAIEEIKASEFKFLDLPTEFCNFLVEQMFTDVYKKRLHTWWTNFLQQVVRDNIDGKTLGELFELLDYFVKAADS